MSDRGIALEKWLLLEEICLLSKAVQLEVHRLIDFSWTFSFRYLK